MEARPSIPSVTELEAIDQLLRIGDLLTPIVVRTASTMGIADQFGQEPVRAEEIAERLSVSVDPLRRLLGALEEAGVVARDEAGAFTLTDVGRVLRRDHPLSMRDAFGLAITEIRAWTELEHCIRTCGSGFERAYGESHRSFRARHLDEDARMDRAHQAATRLDLLTLARAYPWNEVRTVVDVGGGTGTFLAGILSRFPELHGTLFDLPRMVANAPDVIERYAVGNRCRIVGGSFFEDVPAGADLYVLKAVVGGWDEESCTRILSTVRRAMRVDSRLLIIEPIMIAGSEFSTGNVVQMQSLVLYGGRDRTFADYTAIGQSAGLAIRRVIRRSTLPIVELVPV
jgi:hypothetical protein